MELPILSRDWPEAARESLEERAAILEFEGGLPRDVAEERAALMVREQWAMVSRNDEAQA